MVFILAEEVLVLSKLQTVASCHHARCKLLQLEFAYSLKESSLERAFEVRKRESGMSELARYLYVASMLSSGMHGCRGLHSQLNCGCVEISVSSQIREC